MGNSSNRFQTITSIVSLLKTKFLFIKADTRHHSIARFFDVKSCIPRNILTRLQENYYGVTNGWPSSSRCCTRRGGLGHFCGDILVNFWQELDLFPRTDSIRYCTGTRVVGSSCYYGTRGLGLCTSESLPPKEEDHFWNRVSETCPSLVHHGSSRVETLKMGVTRATLLLPACLF